jgi:hypothetical protein
MLKSWKSSAAALLASCALLSANLRAQTTLTDEVHTVAAASVAVPVEHKFTIATAGTYQVTLVDLGAALTPAAPLVSVKLAITSGSTVVGTPLTKAGSAQFSATPGPYVIHVIGLPDSTKPGSGPIGIQVTNTADNTQVGGPYSDTLALPSMGIPNNQGVLDDSFTVASTGSYQVTLADFQFPQALPTLTLAIAQQGGALVTTLPGGTNPVSLQAGVSYRIFAVGQAGTSVNAGLYGVSITPAGGGAPVYSQSVPVGAVTLLGAPVLAAGSYTLSFADLVYPNPLSPAGAVVALNGQSVAQLTAAGTQTFTATPGTFQVFAVGLPAAPAATGSYSVTLASQSTPVLSLARAVSASGSAVTAYSFDTTVTTAGTYALNLVDLGLATQFTSLSAAAIQNGFRLGSPLTATGSLNVIPAAGPVTLLVFAQPGTGGSLFGIDLTPSGGSSPLFATTQGVGQLFDVRTITIPTAGSYTVTVADVGFPTNLASLAVAVTQGANNLGQIFTGGSFNFTATPGTYFLNFIAQPQPATVSADQAGTYSVSVAPTPPAPVVTFAGSASTVTSGGTITLTWSSQNATSCAGSSTPAGVWSTSQLSGNAQPTGSITTSTTFTLKCTGEGGSTTQTASVTVSSAASGKGGGGGSVSLDVVALLAALTLMRLGASTRCTRQRPGA